MSQLDDEWNEALDEEYGDGTPEAPEEEAPEEETPEVPETPEEEAPETPDEEDPEEEPQEDPEEEAPEEETPETPEEEAQETPEEKAPAPKVDAEPEEKSATREEIKKALKELQSEEATRTGSLDSLKDDVLNTLYPEGVDRQLRDADGDPIRGIEDLTGVDPQTGAHVGPGLINPVTGDVFTEDEAGRYILRGQQRLNEQVKLMEDQAYQIAETQLSLKDSSERVEERFGQLLDKLPTEITDQIANAYIRTLHRDPKTGIVVGAPLDAYEFYSIALAGVQGLEQAPAAQSPAAQSPPPVTPKQRGDRADLAQRGTPSRMSEDEREWENAFNEILE